MIERLARLPVDVDYASEYRYRNPIPDRNALGLLITQSGETADTLAAQREMIALGSKTVAICNVVDAMVAREAHGASIPMPARRSASPPPRPSPRSLPRSFCWRSSWASCAAARSGAVRRAIEELSRIPAKIEEVLRHAPRSASSWRKISPRRATSSTSVVACTSRWRWKAR